MDSIPQQLLLQVILILINAFFAMTEIAVISLTPGRLRMLAEEGDKAAPKLLKLVEEPAGFLSTIQIAITLAGFLSSAFAADSFAGYLVDWVYTDLGFQSLSRGTLNTLSVIVITLILSYFTLVLGELTPKRIAMQKPSCRWQSSPAGWSWPWPPRRGRRCGCCPPPPRAFEAAAPLHPAGGGVRHRGGDPHDGGPGPGPGHH